MSMEQELSRDHNKNKKQRQEDFETRMKIMKEVEVVCATTIASGSDFFSRLSFQGILVDEVAQATEISTMVPVVLRGAKQLVFVGDHCQLPPSVVSREAERRGLSVSVYSRLVDVGIEPHFLDTQYRSHPKLAEFCAKCFYNGTLRSGVPGSARSPPSSVPWPNKQVPVAFFEVGENETVDGESKANTAEVLRIQDLLLEILEAGELDLEHIGIVTPYMAQVRALRRALRGALPDHCDPKMLEIASVDNFQGREKELIIFSAVRCNSRGNVGFLADWRRLNVILTRARRGLVVFGAADTLRYDSHWQQWLKWCDDHGAIGHAKAPSARAASWSIATGSREQVWHERPATLRARPQAKVKPTAQSRPLVIKSGLKSLARKAVPKVTAESPRTTKGPGPALKMSAKLWQPTGVNASGAKVTVNGSRLAGAKSQLLKAKTKATRKVPALSVTPPWRMP